MPLGCHCRSTFFRVSLVFYRIHYNSGKISIFSKTSPEHVRAPLLQNRLLMLVEQLSGVEHVKEVELGIDRDWSLNPGLVGRRALLDSKLLKSWTTIMIFC